jgi:hypothetical protein
MLWFSSILRNEKTYATGTLFFTVTVKTLCITTSIQKAWKQHPGPISQKLKHRRPALRKRRYHLYIRNRR